MKNLVIIFLVIGWGSQAQTSRELQYAAYLKASKTMWVKSVNLADSESGTDSIEKAKALYGLLNNTMASEDEATFNEYKKVTIHLLKSLIESDDKNGEPKALLSAVYGLEMAYSPMKGMFLGMKSSALMEEAVDQSPDSPLVQKLFANAKLYTPEMWGGSPEVAEQAFEKCIRIYEAQEHYKDDWVYLDALVSLSLAQNKLGKEEAARETLNKVIGIEPQHFWAKSILASLTK
jgi:tetratricopeptide (TPR) repeat protein